MEEIIGRVEDCLSDLLAVEPVYHRESGDACHLHLRSGEVVLDGRSMRGVKQALARIKAQNQVYLRRLCGEELGRQLSLPIPLSARLILVPLKMRQPLTGNDSAYGLVNLLAVRKVVARREGGALVVLESGQSLRVLGTRENVLTRLGEGALMHRHFVQEVWGI